MATRPRLEFQPRSPDVCENVGRTILLYRLSPQTLSPDAPPSPEHLTLLHSGGDTPLTLVLQALGVQGGRTCVVFCLASPV